MATRQQSMLRTIPTVWLLMWSSIQPLIVASPPPTNLGTCSGSDAGAGSCGIHEHGVGISLLQARSKIGKMETAYQRNFKNVKEKCVICVEIEKEVQSQVTKQVATEIEGAKTVIEKELLRQLLVRHNTTIKELEKVVEEQMKGDMDNENKIQDLEEKLEEDFVKDGVVTKLQTRLETIEERLTVVETQLQEITTVIEEINTNVDDLKKETSEFVNATNTKIKELSVLIKETNKKTEVEILSQVTMMIQKTTENFKEQILEKTEERISQSITTTLVKVERIVQEAVEREKEVHEAEHKEVKEKIEENWEKIVVMIKDLREAIEEGKKAQVTNSQEIASLKESIEGVALAAAKKIVGEHSKETQTTIQALEERLEDLTVTVEEEADMATERDKDIISIAELIKESELKMMNETQEFIKKEAETVKKGADEAKEKLELEIANIKSTASEDKAKLEALKEKLSKVQETVTEEEELRIKNVESITLLKEEAASVKRLISEVKIDIELHKESSHKQTIEEVKILMKQAQESTILKAKEVSVKEMMTEITTVKESVETNLKTTVTIIKEGLKEEEEKRVGSKQKMEAKIEALKKQVAANTDVTEQTKADQEQLSDAVELLIQSVEEGDAQHAKAAEEIEELNVMIEHVVDKVQAQKEKFPSKQDMEKLEAAVTKINGKVIGLDEKLTKETELQEASVLSLEKRVTANEEHLDELEVVIQDMQSDIVGIAEIVKEIHAEQDQVADKAVQEALKAVGGMIEKTTTKMVEESEEMLLAETKEMISQVEKTISIMQKAVEEEAGKREKADAQIQVLKQKVVELTNSLDKKADSATMEKVSKMVTMIQSTLRSEKEIRASSEKEMVTIKQAMQTIYEKTEKKEKEIKTIKEVSKTHIVHHVHKVESTKRITAVSKKAMQVEAQTVSQISKLSSHVSSVKAKLEVDEAARLKSNAALQILEEQTMTLFKKCATTSDKMDALDAKITERIESLTAMLNEVSIKMQVSAESSKSDLGRMDKMLQSLLADLASEESARAQGDAKAEAAVMARVEVLMEELSAAQAKAAAAAAASHSESKCHCDVVEQNGVKTTKCEKDGVPVPSCGIEDWTPSGDVGEKITIEGGGSSSSSSSSSSKTSCECTREFKDGDFHEVCLKDGKEVPQSECSSIKGMEGMDDLMAKLKDQGDISDIISKSDATVLDDQMVGKCHCVTTKTGDEIKSECKAGGEVVPRSDCEESGMPDLNTQDSTPDEMIKAQKVKTTEEASIVGKCHCFTEKRGDDVIKSECKMDGQVIPREICESMASGEIPGMTNDIPDNIPEEAGSQ